MSQENRENSVLFSLRELRDIEQNRIQDEEDARTQAEEAEQMRLQAERQRAEAERQRLEDEERQRVEEIERQRREEQFRLEEAERRARIEAEAAIEQQRLEQEMALRRQEISKKRPTWLLGVAGVLFLCIIGGGVWGYQTYQEREKAAADKVAAERDAEESRQRQLALEAEIAELSKQIEDAQQKLAAATTEEARAAARAELDNLRNEANRKRDARKRNPRKRGRDNAKPGTGRQIQISDKCRKNPLDC